MIGWKVLPGETRKGVRERVQGKGEKGKSGNLGNLDPAGIFGVLLCQFVLTQGKVAGCKSFLTFVVVAFTEQKAGKTPRKGSLRAGVEAALSTLPWTHTTIRAQDTE